MPNYKYAAITGTGQLKVGYSIAHSVSLLRDELHSQGLCVLRIRRAWWDFSRGERGMAPAELLSVSRELSALLRGGVTLAEALALLSTTTEGVASAVLSRSRQALVEGLSPSAAFAAQEPAFPADFIQMVELGERSGDLAGALATYAAHARRRQAIRSRLRQASYYPVMLLAVILLALSVLLLFSVPRFARMYEDLGAPMPAVTELLLSLSHHFPWLIAALAAGAWAIYARAGGASFLWRLALRLPMARDVVIAYERAAFTRNLAALLAGGMTATRAIESAAESLPPLFAEKLWRVSRQIAGGTALARAIADAQVLTPTGLRIVEVAERTGTLPRQVSELADLYEEQLDNALARAVALIEPGMILVMGVVVGAIVLAMYLPIFSLAGAVR